jgi:hypothetical protein
MSDRERWIIYPLVIVTLGMYWRDKFMPTEKLMTHQLLVLNKNDEPVVTINSSDDGGLVRVSRDDGSLDLVLGHKGSSSSLFVETPTDHGSVLHSVVGNLRRFAPNQPDHWLLEIPQLNPTPPKSRGQPQSADHGAEK